MTNRKISVFEKMARPFALFIVFAFVFAIIANAQGVKCKWTHDIVDDSGKTEYFETPLDACKDYVKDKYPNDNYKASIEATNSPDMFRCSAGDTYIGLVSREGCSSFSSELCLAREHIDISVKPEFLATIDWQ